MAGSVSFTTPAQIPGLTLRAWAFVTPGGALVKGGNVSSVVRNSAGNYTVTFAVAMADASVLVALESTASSVGNIAAEAYIQAVSTASLTYQTMISGAATDTPGLHWIGVYG